MSFVVLFNTLSYFLCLTKRSMATSTDFCIRFEITCNLQRARINYVMQYTSDNPKIARRTFPTNSVMIFVNFNHPNSNSLRYLIGTRWIYDVVTR